MYYFSKVLEATFDEAIARAIAALKAEGFGVLTEIDVKATLKKKIDVDFRPYKILGACNAPIAHQMLQIDDKAGVWYPCNVVVQQREDGKIEIAAIDPLAMFQAVEGQAAREVAQNARIKMQAVMNRLEAPELVTAS
ncbi:MAG: DUF302 domain-containing protein [Spirulina sp.]